MEKFGNQVAEEWFSKPRTYPTVTEAKQALSEIVSKFERDSQQDKELRELQRQLTCGAEDGSHYCPSCDNSLFNAKALIDELVQAQSLGLTEANQESVDATGQKAHTPRKR